MTHNVYDDPEEIEYYGLSEYDIYDPFGDYDNYDPAEDISPEDFK